MTRDENDRNVGSACQQMFLHFQAAHAAHAYIKQQHGDFTRIIFGDEALAAVVKLNAIVACFQ